MSKWQWRIENRGCDAGRAMLMEEIKANPKKLPARPPDLPTHPEGPGL